MTQRDMGAAGDSLSRDRPLDVKSPNAGALAAAIGMSIRRLRSDAGLTVQALSDVSGLSQPFLSQLENGKSMPSIMTLHKVAAALGTTAQALIALNTPEIAGVVRAGQGRQFVLKDGATVRFLAQNRTLIEATEVVAGPGVDSGVFSHAGHLGEEMIHVLDGSLEVTVGGTRTEVLEGGDTICYAADTSHLWRVVGDKDVRFLMFTTPPTF